MTLEDFEKIYTFTDLRLIYNEADAREKIRAIKEEIGSGSYMKRMQFAEMIMGRSLSSFEQVIMSECFKVYDMERERRVNRLIENGVVMQAKEVVTGRDVSEYNVVKRVGIVSIHHTPNGFYASTPNDFSMASEYFPTLMDLERSDVIQLMNNVYTDYKKKEEVPMPNPTPEQVGDNDA